MRKRVPRRFSTVYFSKCVSCIVAAATAILCFFFTAAPSRAQVTIENSVPAVLYCSALSTNPRGRPEYSAEVKVQLSKGSLMVERMTGRRTERPGTERLTGSVDKKGTIKLAGEGRRDDGTGGWKTELSGNLNTRGQTVLYGGARNGFGTGEGTRRCKLTFSIPTSELRTRLSAMFELEQRQEALEEQQSRTAEKVDGVTSVLKDIILPVTERPGDWMMRVAAVPVQQQQLPHSRSVLR